MYDDTYRTDLRSEPPADPREPEEGAVPEAGAFGRAIDKAGLIFAVGLVAAAGVLLLEVVLRYLFDSPTIWAHETAIFLCALGFVYGGLYCAAKDRHIRVVLIYDQVTGRARRLLDCAIALVCAGSACFFTYASWLMVEKAIFRPNGDFVLETSGSAWNPPTPALLKCFLLAVMAALAIQFAVLAFNYARGSHAHGAGGGHKA